MDEPDWGKAVIAGTVFQEQRRRLLVRVPGGWVDDEGRTYFWPDLIDPERFDGPVPTDRRADD